MANRRILILDDDAAVGQTIQWIAESLGFEAAFVTRPEEFFSKLVEMNPEIITIDLVMPKLDGVEIMNILAERKSRQKSSYRAEWARVCSTPPSDRRRSMA